MDFFNELNDRNPTIFIVLLVITLLILFLPDKLPIYSNKAVVIFAFILTTIFIYFKIFIQ